MEMTNSQIHWTVPFHAVSPPFIYLFVCNTETRKRQKKEEETEPRKEGTIVEHKLMLDTAE